MKKTLPYLLFPLCCILLCSCSSQEKKVLLFSKTEAFRHSSIEDAVISIKNLLETKNIQITTTEDANYFTEDSLKNYATVIFLNTTGNVLNNLQQADFERYIQAGGGFVGIHAATDTEYNWPWYNQLVGAYFDGHPAIQKANLTCIKKDEACCQNVPKVWTLNEEWYNFKSINPEIEVLMTIDESSYIGGTHEAEHPVVWKHEFDGGRSFYTAIGHNAETFEDPIYQQQLFAGIEFAIGNNHLDYSKVSSIRVPEENRFSKQVLDFNLNEPMEIDELGERGIICIERRGLIKLYDYESEQMKILDTIDVHYDDEDGLLGIAVDPNFDENNRLYVFYSPNTEEAIQHVSEFTLINNKLEEEKVLLKIPLIRECCHSGGSLEFDKDGLLYIGLGDNTNPFESSGYAPIDERANRALFDAQRSAANTNDLRGKILRIKPDGNGSYSIPQGNLFPEGTKDTRPEIYVMGLRNPFRFSIDSKTNYLYWGDVGPDAGIPDSIRGPIGMGEFNQAKEAGFYGWPYSRGNNQMYFDYAFNTKRSGLQFASDRIINDSPNNTGIAKLPPIQKSMIWYSYKKSNDFPWLGEGGVNPMSGPIYHAEEYTLKENALPEYFENKWFVYEWMRDWIYVVHLDENHQIVQADPFMSNTEFSHPMDMLFSKEGKLYILEYGQKWNSQNLDARLSVINYNSGNRAPIAHFEVDQEVGAAPLSVAFSAVKSNDFDKDKLSYHWSFEDETIQTDEANIKHTFNDPGIYNVILTVKDVEGEEASFNKKILVGNEPPKISFNLSDPNTTYWNNKKLDYTIDVTDLEDGSIKAGTLDPSKVKLTFNYIPEGEDKILASIGHQQNAVPKGLDLINVSNCKSCHAIKSKVAGPSYEEIAARYEEKDTQTMMHRIIKGSQGVWGEQMMAPHPQLTLVQVEEMVNYILSLDVKKQIEEKPLALKGTITFDKHLEDDVAGKYVLMASYLDEGNPAIEGSSLSVLEEVVFIPPKIELEDGLDLDKRLGVWNSQNRTLVGSIKDGRHIKIAPISFNKLSSISIGAAFSKDYPYKGNVEIRQEAINGKKLGQGEIQFFDQNKDGFKVFEIDLQASSGTDTLFLVFKNPLDTDQYTMNGDWIQLNYEN